jgi:hypothetical protein
MMSRGGRTVKAHSPVIISLSANGRCDKALSTGHQI